MQDGGIKDIRQSQVIWLRCDGKIVLGCCFIVFKRSFGRLLEGLSRVRKKARIYFIDISQYVRYIMCEVRIKRVDNVGERLEHISFFKSQIYYYP